PTHHRQLRDPRRQRPAPRPPHRRARRRPPRQRPRRPGVVHQGQGRGGGPRRGPRAGGGRPTGVRRRPVGVPAPRHPLRARRPRRRLRHRHGGARRRRPAGRRLPRRPRRPPPARAPHPRPRRPRRRRVPGPAGQRPRVPPGGPAPDQTPQQGRLRPPCPLPEPQVTTSRGVNYQYRAWDGSQDHLDLDPEDLLAELTDDLLAGGDLDDALRRLMRSGMDTASGERVMGLREMIERLRQRRADLLDQGDPDGELARLSEALDEVVGTERDAIDGLEADARESGDDRRRQVTDDVAAEKRIALDLLPEDLAGKVRELQQYEFVSSEARERFEQLVEDLRQEVADTYFKGMSDAMSSMDPEQIARMRDA